MKSQVSTGASAGRARSRPRHRPAAHLPRTFTPPMTSHRVGTPCGVTVSRRFGTVSARVRVPRAPQPVLRRPCHSRPALHRAGGAQRGGHRTAQHNTTARSRRAGSGRVGSGRVGSRMVGSCRVGSGHFIPQPLRSRHGARSRFGVGKTACSGKAVLPSLP